LGANGLKNEVVTNKMILEKKYEQKRKNQGGIESSTLPKNIGLFEKDGGVELKGLLKQNLRGVQNCTGPNIFGQGKKGVIPYWFSGIWRDTSSMIIR